MFNGSAKLVVFLQLFLTVLFYNESQNRVYVRSHILDLKFKNVVIKRVRILSNVYSFVIESVWGGSDTTICVDYYAKNVQKKSHPWRSRSSKIQTTQDVSCTVGYFISSTSVLPTNTAFCIYTIDSVTPHVVSTTTGCSADSTRFTHRPHCSQ